MHAYSSRLSQLVEDSSRARRFPDEWYEINKPRNNRFSAPAIDTEINKVGIQAFSASSSVAKEAEAEWRAMDDEIREARYILAIENDEGFGDFVPYTKETFNRATSFLTRQMIHAHSARLIGMGVPRICPADRGSIDLYWEKSDRTLLINFPSDSEIANYYGKRPKSEISGRFEPTEARVELVSWLADQ